MKRLLLTLLKNDCGAVLPMLGIGLVMLVIATGTAVDMARAQLVQARLSSALDAAGLAAGASISTANAQQEAQKYFDANFPTGYLNTTLGPLTVTPNANNTLLTLNITASVPTTLMMIAGQTHVDVSAYSEITRENKGLELVMVLDNTGSMSGEMEDLKNAAKSLISTLYGSQTTIEHLWVGLVPFSQAVNIGTSRSHWLDGHTFNWGPDGWGGCVDARGSGGDRTDDPPSTQLFRAYYWPDDDNNDWIRNNGQYRSTSASLGPNRQCPRALLPMVANKHTVNAAIDTMEARGNTHVNVGAVWGWRMLSPRWRNLWGGEMDTNALPLDYNTPLMNKAVIIMTDGDNTMDNNNHTAYWYLEDGKLGTTNRTNAEAQLDTRLASVCSSMKANNILVYTIGFNNPGTTISNLLRNCASQPDYYFNSPTSTDLQRAFRQIGDSLASLRISR